VAKKSSLVTVVVAALLLLGAGLVVSAGESPAAAASTAGCGKTPTLRNGTYTIQSGGQNRTYILRIPDNYQPTLKYRLFVGLHWLNGSAQNVADGGGAAGSAWAFYGQQRASNNGAIFIAPQGLDAGWANTGGRDVTLVDDILRVVENDLCVDTTQRFALGWSYGGSMSFALACARPAVFRAVVAYSGAQLSGCAGGTQPVAYFGIHGTRDSVLPVDRGRQIRDVFVRANGCTAQSPPEPANGSGRHITTAYSGCRDGYPVQWAAFDGDHTPEPTDGGGLARRDAVEPAVEPAVQLDAERPHRFHLPGVERRQRLEQRADRQPDRHQYRRRRRQRLVAHVQPRRRPDHHLRLERHLLPVLGPGDGAQRRLQRHHRSGLVDHHRLPGPAHRQQFRAGRVRPERRGLCRQLTFVRTGA
jgi:poly(3-hydroxybutyrate) depolymerase